MLGSNQRPLPCESSESVTDTSCCVGDSRYFSVISLFSTLRLFGSFRLRCGSVAAPLLHILKVKRKQEGSARRGVWFCELRLWGVLRSLPMRRSASRGYLETLSKLADLGKSRIWPKSW